MYRNAYQKGGYLTVFYAIGRSPLKYWKCQTRDGHCKRVIDEDLNSMALEMLGTNVSTCLITTPIPPYRSLGIKMPFITIILKNLQKYCTFEIEIRDHENQLRRFQASNFQPHTRTNMFITQMPLRLDPGWNKIEINLADFTHRAYGTRYVETVSIRINANVRLRRIYFTDQLYSEEDKPREYRLYVSDYAVLSSSAPLSESEGKNTPVQMSSDSKVPTSSPGTQTPQNLTTSDATE